MLIIAVIYDFLAFCSFISRIVNDRQGIDQGSWYRGYCQGMSACRVYSWFSTVRKEMLSIPTFMKPCLTFLTRKAWQRILLVRYISKILFLCSRSLLLATSTKKEYCVLVRLVLLARRTNVAFLSLCPSLLFLFSFCFELLFLLLFVPISCFSLLCSQQYTILDHISI